MLAATSGTLFGQPVTADTLTTLVSGLDNPIGVAVDGAGNLYYATQNAINVLPATTTTLYGQTVTADTPAALVSGLVEGRVHGLRRPTRTSSTPTSAGWRTVAPPRSTCCP